MNLIYDMIGLAGEIVSAVLVLLGACAAVLLITAAMH